MTQTPIRVPSDVAQLGASIPYPDLIPEEYFRNSLDLNRFSNKISREIVESYNRIILRAVDKLEAIERLPRANQPKYTAARLRALLLQTKASLRNGMSNQRGIWNLFHLLLRGCRENLQLFKWNAHCPQASGHQ